MKVICITSRALRKDDFLAQIIKICAGGADRIILREKDMDEYAYEALAAEMIKLCRIYGTRFITHTHVRASLELGVKNIHMSYAQFMSDLAAAEQFESVGVSVHSAAEARAASRCGAEYLIAGHIFPTDCKKDIPPRGIGFLQEICENASVPVYAIGGITPENAPLVKAAGAEGICVMSSIMTAEKPSSLISEFKSI
ncbi:MAG: thiamine phosphate synthase [Huintestinicola sp.]